MSKGSNRRPYDKNEWDERFDDIFNKKRLDAEERTIVSGISVPKSQCVFVKDGEVVGRIVNIKVEE